MKKIVFDTSSIISIVTNNLLGTLKLLKKKFSIEFYVPYSVKYELVDKALDTNKFKFEGVMLSRAIRDGVLKVYSKLDVEDLLVASNSVFVSDNKPLHVLDRGEIEALALACKIDADAYCVDERTMRMIIENPKKLRELLSNKLQTRIDIDQANLKIFNSMIKSISIIRSTEIMVVAFENGLLDKYISIDTPKNLVLDALLWGLRLRGCSISTEDIDEILKIERKV